MNDGYLKLIAASLIWGTTGVFVRWCAETPLLKVAFYRSLTAALFILLLILSQRRVQLPCWNRFPLLFLTGFFQAAGTVFYYAALNRAALCSSMFTFYLSPVFVVMLAPLCFQEKIEKSSYLALVLSLGGLGGILLSSSPAQFAAGVGWAFLGAVCFSFIVLAARALLEVEGLVLVFWQMLFSALLLWPLVHFAGIEEVPTVKEAAAILILGVFHTALGYTIYFDGLKEVRLQEAGVLLYLDPVSATIIGYLVFQELIQPAGLVGAALIVVAGMMVMVKK